MNPMAGQMNSQMPQMNNQMNPMAGQMNSQMPQMNNQMNPMAGQMNSQMAQMNPMGMGNPFNQMGQMNNPSMNSNMNSLSNNNSMKVFFRLRDGGSQPPIMIKCSLNDKVSDIINKYKAKASVDLNGKKYLFKEKELNLNSTLEDAGLIDNSNIFIVSK